jgi:hypothetical protein
MRPDTPEPRCTIDGFRAFGGPVALYSCGNAAGGDAEGFAHQAGVGCASLRLIATDRRGQMDARA